MNWQTHLEQCHWNPDTLKGPPVLNQSHDLNHLQGIAHLSTFKTARTGKITNQRVLFPFFSGKLLRATPEGESLQHSIIYSGTKKLQTQNKLIHYLFFVFGEYLFKNAS